MIFEQGWFLHKMNKYAPRGYKFIVSGPDNRITMYAPEFMGEKSPSGPFVSNFSFDMLDSVYGGLLTRRSSHLHQGAMPADYLYNYDLGRPKNVPADEKYNIYRSVIEQYVHTSYRPRSPLIRKNAILIQGLQDANANLPKYLSKRLHNYVNKCTWYAIEKVLSSMPICDMRYYQEQYRNKMREMGIRYGEKFGAMNIEQISFDKRYANLTVKIEELKYDILPRHEKSLARAISRSIPPEKQQQIQGQLDKTRATLADLVAEQRRMEPKAPSSLAQHILSDVFFENGRAVIPKISSNKTRQMLQLLCMRENKTHKK